VSAGKFEAISAILLARKGDAAPSVVAPVGAPPRRALLPRDIRPTPSEPAPFPSGLRQSDDPDKRRRIVLPIAREDLERLSIVAIKKGVSRQDILRGALHDYLRKLSDELPHPCACVECGPCRTETAC
jgi:hypothetical protein